MPDSQAASPRSAGGEIEVLARILIAVDGSEASFCALEYALALASAAGTKLSAIVVEETTVATELASSRGQMLSRLTPELAAGVQTDANEIEQRMRETAERRGVRVSIGRQTGHVGDCVVAAADEASVLVLGRRGHRENRSGLLGSNTESIVRRTRRPLLIAPRRYRPIGGVLVAYGGKDLGGIALDTGREIAGALGLPLEVLTIADQSAVATAIQARARARLGEAASTTRFSASVGDPATVITDCGDHGTLIVMGAYGHSRLYRAMLGSVTEQVVRSARSPVLLSAKPGDAEAK